MIGFSFENNLLKRGEKIIIGLDEAGRGPLAGPVVVGAVVFNADFLTIKKAAWWKKINDSKKLSPSLRKKLYQKIKKNMCFSVGMVSNDLIDKIGINKAIERAANKALKKICIKPNVILQDGIKKFVPKRKCSYFLIKKGDAKIFSIACASIVAKVERDKIMIKSHKKWPKYSFEKHKGYGTAQHIKTIREIGPCPIHRLSYAPLSKLPFSSS